MIIKWERRDKNPEIALHTWKVFFITHVILQAHAFFERALCTVAVVTQNGKSTLSHIIFFFFFIGIVIARARGCGRLLLLVLSTVVVLTVCYLALCVSIGLVYPCARSLKRIIRDNRRSLKKIKEKKETIKREENTKSSSVQSLSGLFINHDASSQIAWVIPAVSFDGWKYISSL